MSATTIPTSRAVKSNLTGIAHSQARDYGVVVQRVNEHFTVSCWSCHDCCHSMWNGSDTFKCSAGGGGVTNFFGVCCRATGGARREATK